LPTYSYYCPKCNNTFELFFTIGSYTGKPQKCSSCKTLCDRNYLNDISSLTSSIKKADSELKTLGDLANRNRDKMTNDHKQSLHIKHNSYKESPSNKELPKGMSRIKKPNKPIWPN
jgi:putative FmdB family regulatory protein